MIGSAASHDSQLDQRFDVMAAVNTNIVCSLLSYYYFIFYYNISHDIIIIILLQSAFYYILLLDFYSSYVMKFACMNFLSVK